MYFDPSYATGYVLVLSASLFVSYSRTLLNVNPTFMFHVMCNQGRIPIVNSHAVPYATYTCLVALL